MIKNVLLDLDQTVFDFHRSEAESLKGALSQLGIGVTDRMLKRYHEINDAQWKRLERGEATREEILSARFAVLFSEFGIKADPLSMRANYEAHLSRSYFFMDGAERMLCEVSREYDLYLASNGTDSVQTGRIAASGISKYFKDIFISERLGANKPSKKYFEECARRILGYTREETIIVGDSLSSDILGGIRAGISTCLYNPEKKANATQIHPHYEIYDLGDLLPLLRSI